MALDAVEKEVQDRFCEFLSRKCVGAAADPLPQKAVANAHEEASGYFRGVGAQIPLGGVFAKPLGKPRYLLIKDPEGASLRHIALAIPIGGTPECCRRMDRHNKCIEIPVLFRTCEVSVDQEGQFLRKGESWWQRLVKATKELRVEKE